MIELLKTLCALNGVSGGRGRRCGTSSAAQAEPYADSMPDRRPGQPDRVQEGGQKATATGCCCAAHMDEVGLIVTRRHRRRLSEI